MAAMRMLADDNVLAVLFPTHAASQWAADQLGFGPASRLEREIWQLTGKVLRLQTREKTTYDLTIFKWLSH
jgi:hypothetical protein